MGFAAMAAGVAVFLIGLHALIARVHVVRMILALNVMASGVFLVLIGAGSRIPALAPDPVPQAMVLTGIVVAVSTTAVALALVRRLAGSEATGTGQPGGERGPRKP